ncbi:MAG: DMT family transporter, partial [Thermoplasmata archaeon]|nr:DMT family transporter [Thermoplasmata archaeon]
ADFRISRKQFPPLLYVAIVGTVFADLMYFFALTQVPVVNAVVIGHLQPVFIVLMGYILLRGDRLNRFDYLGVLFMILSGLLVSTKTVENFANLKFGSMGDLFVLFATVAWATTTIAARKYLRELNAGVITFYRFLVASVFFTVYLVFFSYVSVSSVYQVLVGVVVGVGTILYYEGLKRIKAAQVSAVELSTPFFAAILGFVVLGEGVTLLQIVGMFLLFVGIYYLSKKE